MHLSRIVQIIPLLMLSLLWFSSAIDAANQDSFQDPSSASQSVSEATDPDRSLFSLVESWFVTAKVTPRSPRLSSRLDQPGRNGEDGAPLEQYRDPSLQRSLEQTVHSLGLGGAVSHRRLAMALVDITDLNAPRVAAINGNAMMYAASLPKIAVLLAVYAKVAEGGLSMTPGVREQVMRMIRKSDNEATTSLMHLVGKEYIAKVLMAPRYKLYDPARNGGLWVGKDYGKDGLWKRDPLHSIAHGATALQVARFYYLLEAGRLVSRQASAEMKEVLDHTAINHKFRRGLSSIRPDAKIFRKSGTWQDFHADSGIVERRGAKYIAVGLAEDPEGGEWMQRLIVGFDQITPGVKGVRQMTASVGESVPAEVAVASVEESPRQVAVASPTVTASSGTEERVVTASFAGVRAAPFPPPLRVARVKKVQPVRAASKDRGVKKRPG